MLIIITRVSTKYQRHHGYGDSDSDNDSNDSEKENGNDGYKYHNIEHDNNDDVD